MTLIEMNVVNAALREVGAPYVWRGKGDMLWTPDGPLVGTMTESTGRSVKGFDCSGLVTWALREAGLGDKRLTENAQTMFDQLTAPPAGGTYVEAHPALSFYGTGPKTITHVAIAFSVYGYGYVIEAAGGDHTTLTVADARARRACVRVGPAVRKDLVGVRILPSAAGW